MSRGRQSSSPGKNSCHPFPGRQLGSFPEANTRAPSPRGPSLTATPLSGLSQLCQLGAIWQLPIPLATQVWLGCARDDSFFKGRPLRGAARPPPPTTYLADDLSLEILRPSAERRVSPAGWSSRRPCPSLYIPDSASRSLVGRLRGEAAGGR